MTYANTTRLAQHGLAERLGMIVRSVKESLHRRRVYAVTVRELNALNARELADLGIHKTMITRIALDAAYGK